MNKLIPFILKLVGLGLIITSIFLPLLTISMAVAWEGDVKPPLAPDGANIDFLTANGLGIVVNNITFDETSNSFVEVELDPNSEISSAINLVNQAIIAILVVILILVGIGAVLTILFGRTKLGGLFTFLGGLGGVVYGVSIVIIQQLLFKALENFFGVPIVGDTLSYTISQTILATTYTLEISFAAALGIPVYLSIAGGIVILISLFTRADDSIFIN